MASTLPPDPYAALGVSKTADSGAIKAAYRKLVLKCHPDKVTDESLKAQKREEFDKIQQAYEIVGDEDRRQTYEAELKLETLRREKLARGSSDPRVEVRTASYDIRTAAPGGASFRERGPSRYDDRKSSRYDYDRYDEDRSSSRKNDTYDPYPKRSSPRTTRTTEKETPVRVKVSTDRSRSEYKKSRDQAERRERSGKFVSVDDDYSSDEKARYEAEYRKRTEEAQYEARKRYEAEELKRKAADARQSAETRRRAEERRSAEEIRRHREHRDERERKLSDQESHLRDYVNQAKAVHAESRPTATRTNSSRDVRSEHHKDYERSSRRPEMARRSSARPKEHVPSSARERERRAGIPEIVEWSEEEERRMPSFKQSTSSPAEIQVPRGGPQRAYTTESHSRDHRRSETSPPPVFRRSETMPYPSSRRHETAPTRSSNLRSTETVQPHDSGYSSPSTPEATYPTIPSTSKKYHYSSASGGVRIIPDDISNANGHRTILREPERHRTRSPSPLGRPPIGSNRVVQSNSSSRYQSAPVPPPTSATIPPPLNRAATINVSPNRAGEWDRGRKLYGEISSEYSKRENARRQTSFSPERVSYTKRIGPEDIRWSRGRDSGFDRPPMRKQYSVY